MFIFFRSKYKQPQLRPKGLGLGADKVVKENQKKSSKENDEDLAIVKKALVKVTMGKYAGFYGQVEFFMHILDINANYF